MRFNDLLSKLSELPDGAVHSATQVKVIGGDGIIMEIATVELESNPGEDNVVWIAIVEDEP